MNFNEYQAKALRTNLTTGDPSDFYHLVLGLVGEAGEIAEKAKKILRDQDSDQSKIDKAAMTKELGDVLWYLAVLADYLEIPFQDIADKNIAKLASRLERNTLKGSGDDR